jgi:hypothetical protein
MAAPQIIEDARRRARTVSLLTINIPFAADRRLGGPAPHKKVSAHRSRAR